MLNVALLYRLRAIFARGALRISRRTKVPRSATIIWKDGSVSIGPKAFLRRGIVIDAQRGSIDIGRNVSLNDYTILLGRGGITIGNDVRIAAHAMVVSFDHNFDDPTQPIRMQGVTKKPVVIEDDVWIGAGAKILGGSYISKGCVIGANSVVKGRTIPYGVYVGAPAKLIRRRGESDSVRHADFERFSLSKRKADR
ncbi:MULTISPECIES: acyltransferase [unclassified Rhizobium]|uniref:acyltransferase n=1 Tax=unclassified Rhizobium TaxID=2613769 RepID=UPI000CDF4F28|nr:MULTISPECIES: acyltransferase [Rhizobium]AVA20246.1 O-acetyltransferase LpxA-like protein [Rhizobium sp. NXC24]MDK4740635.1 acyltransferase [Rhizobium sp. CNPSo 3464]UWU21540.1 acyltransferase [Rhizobium tropici]